MTRLESFDNFGLENFDVFSVERVTALNSNFPTRIAAENGMFGSIEGHSQIFQRQSGWSTDITNAIESPKAFRIYRNAGLTDMEIGERRALVRNDINWFQIDASDGPTRGLTNMQRIERGLSPLDAKGQPIELHHMGQRMNAPLSELTNAEHKIMHHPIRESEIDRNQFKNERQQYWKDRAEADITRRQITSQTARLAHNTGMREGLHSAMIVGAITTVDNVRGIHSGEVTVQEAAVNISIGVGTAAALGYGTGFISSATTTLSSKSANSAIRTLGKAGLPATAVSFGIMSYDSVVSFAQGEISGTELAYDLAKNASGVAGAIAGASTGGVVAGIPGALVGGMVGYLIAVEAYATVIDVINNGVGAITDRAVAVAETATGLMDKAIELGQSVIDFVATNAPEALDTVRASLNDFASNLRVSSISFG